MSSDEVAPAAPAAPLPRLSAADRHTFRLAAGLVIGFLLAEWAGTILFFLPPLIAVQLLAAMPRALRPQQAVGLVLIAAVASGASYALAVAFVNEPPVYLLLLGLMLFLGFYLDSAGKAAPAGLLLMLAATVPLVAVQSVELAGGVAWAMVEGVALGVLALFAAFVLFPAAPEAEPTVAPPAPQPSPRRALANTLLLLVPVVHSLLTGDMTFVPIMVVLSILRQADRSMAPRMVFGLLLGNTVGGILATVVYGIVSLQWSFPFFLLLVLIVGLVLGQRIAARRPSSPIFVVALASFVILLGIGILPLAPDSSTAFVSRLIDVLLAGLYAFAALSLLRPDRDEAHATVEAG